MTRPTTHALLGELHSILGRYRERDFREASNYGAITHNVRTALRALAKEAETGAEPTETRQRRSGATGISRDWRETTSSLISLLSRTPSFNSNEGLIDLANELGIKLQTKPKESRERLSKRLVNIIDSLPDEERAKVLDAILTLRNSQTHGWVNVIKNSR